MTEEAKIKLIEYRKAYYAKNKDRLLEKQKKYYDENIDARVEYAKKYRRNNYNKCSENNLNYRKNNKDKIRDYAKNYSLSNRDKLREYLREYIKENYDYISKKRKEYRSANAELIKEYKVKYKILNPEYQNEYIKNRRRADPVFRLSFTIRGAIKDGFRGIKLKKSNRTEEILGCSFSEFRKYIESKFESWMNWDNYGNIYGGKIVEENKSWDLDHIIPISSAETIEDVLRLSHYTNFQPLCSYNNRFIKRNKINSNDTGS